MSVCLIAQKEMKFLLMAFLSSIKVDAIIQWNAGNQQWNGGKKKWGGDIKQWGRGNQQWNEGKKQWNGGEMQWGGDIKQCTVVKYAT